MTSPAPYIEKPIFKAAYFNPLCLWPHKVCKTSSKDFMIAKSIRPESRISDSAARRKPIRSAHLLASVVFWFHTLAEPHRHSGQPTQGRKLCHRHKQRHARIRLGEDGLYGYG